jgi:hypothetical protein
MIGGGTPSRGRWLEISRPFKIFSGVFEREIHAATLNFDGSIREQINRW